MQVNRIDRHIQTLYAIDFYLNVALFAIAVVIELSCSLDISISILRSILSYF